MLNVVNFSDNYFHPIVFLLVFNYLYFVIFYFIWYFVDSTYFFMYIDAYKFILPYCFGLLLGLLFFQRVPFSRFSFGLYKFGDFNRGLNITILYFIVVFCYLYKNFLVYGTLQPMDLIVLKKMAVDNGDIYKTTSGLVDKVMMYFFFLLFCLTSFEQMIKKNYFYLLLLIILQTYIGFLSGSKSVVIFPLFYVLMSYHCFIKKLPRSFIILSVVGGLSLMPILEFFRQGFYKDGIDIRFGELFRTFVGRINMQYGMTEFYEKNLTSDSFEYPLTFVHLFLYFIPRFILESIGIDKPLSFPLEYTRYLTGRPDVYMTLAGSGIAESIHNFGFFNSKFIIYIGCFLAGIYNAGLITLAHRASQIFIRNNQVCLFFVLLISVHISGFFDTGFSSLIGFFENLFSLLLCLLVIFISTVFKFGRIKR